MRQVTLKTHITEKIFSAIWFSLCMFDHMYFPLFQVSVWKPLGTVVFLWALQWKTSQAVDWCFHVVWVVCFLCGFNILFWGTFPCYCYSWYFRLNNAFTFVLLSRGETSQIFSLAAKQQLKITGWSWVGKCLWACCWPVILRRWTDKNSVCVFLHSSNNQTRSVDIKSVKPANLPCSVTGKSYNHWNNLVMVRPEEVKLWLCFW